MRWIITLSLLCGLVVCACGDGSGDGTATATTDPVALYTATTPHAPATGAPEPMTAVPTTDASAATADPETAEPETAAPATPAPETVAPLTAAPKTTGPKTTKPKTTKPTTAPKTSAPTPAPKTTKPTAAPKTSAPTPAPKTSAPVEVTAELKKLFGSKCGTCHGKDGKAATKMGAKMGVADMTTAAWQKKFSDAKLKAATRNGVNRVEEGKTKKMKGYKDKLTAAEIDGLVKVMRSFKK